jgi:hypothetical protein
MLFKVMAHTTMKYVSPPVVLFVAAIAIYSVTMNFEFLSTWDDKNYVILNEMINGFTTEHLKNGLVQFFFWKLCAAPYPFIYAGPRIMGAGTGWLPSG